jgi:uncharacterized protein with ATP-grasp and redox domains
LLSKFEVSENQQKDFFQYSDKLMRTNNFKTAPELHRKLSLKFGSISGIYDPFAEEKADSNSNAMKLYDELQSKIKQSNNPFDLALRFAIAGNIMDYAVGKEFDAQKTVEQVASAKLAVDHSLILKHQIDKAKSILYLADNAGEIVFDKLFLETIGHNNVTIAVRGGNALNDATLKDSENIDIARFAKVISNGYDAPSTILEKCSTEFLSIYNSADLIISKGQGNYEGLMDIQNERIFFLLIAKCDVIADLINVEKGSFIVMKQISK